MAADFSNLAALNVDETTLAPYTFYAIPGHPCIWFAPGTQQNKTFWNEIKRIAAERAATEISRPVGSEDSDAEKEAARDRDRVLLAGFAAKKWDRVTDKDGIAVEFTADECLAYFRAMPAWIFDPVRPWVQTNANFIQSSAAVAETLGNG